MILDQISRNTSCGKMFMTCLEDITLESGTYDPLWKIDIGAVSSLIFAAYDYNLDNKININVKHTTLEPKHQGDQSIMHVASNHYSLEIELCSINRVRSFHEIISISDICEADRRILSPVF